MAVQYYPEHNGLKISETNCKELTGYSVDEILSFTGVQGHTDDYTFNIVGN